MKTSLIRELILYRYRYIIGYGLCIGLIGLLLFVDISTVPNGIKPSEMTSSVASNSVNPFELKATDVVNLPYHLLQKLSIGLFGLSPLSIRLPSLILACVAVIILAIMLNKWFRKNIAMLTVLLSTTSAAFISMGRSGTANIIYVTILFIILLAAVELTSRAKGVFLWKVLMTVAGLSLLYMPLGVYVVSALFLAGIFHPHVRYQIKRTKLWQIAVLLLFALIVLSPLILAGIEDLHTLKILFGVDSLRSKMSYEYLSSSINALWTTFFSFGNPYAGRYIAPFLGLPSALLVVFGLVKMVRDRHAARSYMMLVWIIVAIPLLLINPTQLSFIFVPCAILLAIGLETLLGEWYKLFPRNPYARIGALIPLSLIVLGIITISTTRYFYGYNYTDTASTFYPELQAVKKELKPETNTVIVVPEDEVSFYDILRAKYPAVTVTSTLDAVSSKQIVLAKASNQRSDTPNKILTTYFKDNSSMLRVYNAKP